MDAAAAAALTGARPPTLPVLTTAPVPMQEEERRETVVADILCVLACVRVGGVAREFSPHSVLHRREKGRSAFELLCSLF